MPKVFDKIVCSFLQHKGRVRECRFFRSDRSSSADVGNIIFFAFAVGDRAMSRGSDFRVPYEANGASVRSLRLIARRETLLQRSKQVPRVRLLLSDRCCADRSSDKSNEVVKGFLLWFELSKFHSVDFNSCLVSFVGILVELVRILVLSKSGFTKSHILPYVARVRTKKIKASQSAGFARTTFLVLIVSDRVARLCRGKEVQWILSAAVVAVL